ncbi:MAG TPA: carboxypeptidase-like regulatory domain-containing protein, partial [Vicinamibacterales bacterium]|nr:carboxypeptidase-like regulatory domain-containing protein [Vicinamibacterales bacterium]
MCTSRLARLIIGLGISVGLYSLFPDSTSQAQQPTNDVAIDSDDIGGVVSGPNGPEAGVWVIVETRDLPVRYIKTVVTDDRGRFVVPDLPSGSYSVWVRGYGLVDSAKATAKPGQRLTITATPAPNEAAAAHYYPAIYWYSMLKIPAADQFGGKSSIPARLSQNAWISAMKNTGCIGCHQLGQQSTRTIPAALGTFASGADAWRRRVQSGQSGQQMLGQLTGLGDMSFANYGDWIDRIAKGELPFAKPPRPQGVERNIVVTLRDWMNEKQYLHDLIASDRRFPTVNAYGPLVGSPEYSSDVLPILDPVKNVATTFKAAVRDASMPLSLGPGHAAALDALQPSPYWGNERIWDTRVNNHNAMFGRDGRLWLAASVRAPENPAFCKQGSDHPSAKAFPMERAVRHITVFDLKTKKYSFVDTCFSTHHLQFGYDANDTIWTSGGGPVVGWLNSKMFSETGDAAKSQGWTALVLDT